MAQETNIQSLAGRSILTLTIALIVLLIFINSINDASNLVILTVQLIPLLLTLPGQLKGSPRAIQWLCFVDLFFMTHGILLIFTPGGLLLGLTETAICLALFFSAIIFIRASRKPS